MGTPDFDSPFRLYTCSSGSFVHGILTQSFAEGERVIGYASRHMKSQEQKYFRKEKECLSLVWTVQ